MRSPPGARRRSSARGSGRRWRCARRVPRWWPAPTAATPPWPRPAPSSARRSSARSSSPSPRSTPGTASVCSVGRRWAATSPPGTDARKGGRPMTTFVLVHGGWSGGHGFHLLRPLLRAPGHEVFPPSLTGIGERVHLVSPQVDLTTHVQDVVNHVLYEDLDAVVLLGFSYGGLVVTGALAHIAARVRHLVYLDAFVPRDG